LAVRLVAKVGWRPARQGNHRDHVLSGVQGQEEAGRRWSVVARAGQACIRPNATHTGQMMARMKACQAKRP